MGQRPWAVELCDRSLRSFKHWRRSHVARSAPAPLHFCTCRVNPRRAYPQPLGASRPCSGEGRGTVPRDPQVPVLQPPLCPPDQTQGLSIPGTSWPSGDDTVHAWWLCLSKPSQPGVSGPTEQQRLCARPTFPPGLRADPAPPLPAVSCAGGRGVCGISAHAWPLPSEHMSPPRGPVTVLLKSPTCPTPPRSKFFRESVTS